MGSGNVCAAAILIALSVYRRCVFFRGLAKTHLGFAGIDALDDFFDRLVFDDEVADIDCGENLADQIARRDPGAVEAQAASHFIEALELQRGSPAVAVW